MGRSGSAPNPNHQQHQQRDYMVEPLGEDGAEQVVDETGDLKKAHHFAALAGSPAAISAIDSAGQHGGANIRPAPATTDDKPPGNHEDHPPRLKDEQVVACSSALAAGIGAVHRSAKVHGHDLEAGGSEHRFQQPAEGAVLGADVLGEVRAGVSPGRIVGDVVEPPLEHRVGLGRLEVIDEIV
jgi:hypothetical protein